MCHHAQSQLGELGGGKAVAARQRTGHWAVRVALSVSLFVLYILLICIVVVTVRFLCGSVKLPLSRPTGFCLLLSILLPTPAGERVVEQPRGNFVAGRGPKL